MTKQDLKDLEFILEQNQPLNDYDTKIVAVELMEKALISKAKLSELLGVSLIDLDDELKNNF